MIKFENTEVFGWEAAIRGMRNPLKSWSLSDTEYEKAWNTAYSEPPKIGQKDLDLMNRLRNAGADHRKFMRMITVYTDITAPLYWWKEFDTYKVGTVANSCSTMHKIAEKEFTLEDFSCEHLFNDIIKPHSYDSNVKRTADYKEAMDLVINILNTAREWYLETKDKKYWWQMIQLLPSSYNQKRTVMMNYEVLANIYKSRKNHKLDEWSETKLVCDNPEAGIDGWWPNKFYSGFCDWIKTLPYSELITGDTDEIDLSVPKETIDDLEHNDLQTEVYRILKEEINKRFDCKEDEK